LLKTPCYYADEAIRYYLEKKIKKILFDIYGFRNLDLMSLQWEVKFVTAVTPQFKK
jgi:hypothetical protein